jgi:predicted transcriptional regulator
VKIVRLRNKMKIGDLVRLGPTYPDRIGIITRVFSEDEQGPLDVEVLIKGKLEKREQMRRR